MEEQGGRLSRGNDGLLLPPAPRTRGLRWILVLCLFCVPSGFVTWHARDVPQLGSLGDDAIYLVAAKSLAAGQGYRLLSLPGAPAMTKYPPGYPALLSLAWRVNPRFPANMAVAALLAWLMLPLLLIVARRTFLRMGLAPAHAGVLCASMALNAPLVWFGMNLMPELAFTCVLLACVVVADSGANGWRAAGAGLLGAAAFLLKSAALPLLLTSPFLYLLRKQYRAAALFFGAMFPFVAGWMWWAHAHRAPPGDATWTFYTDYLGNQALNVPLRDYPLVVSTNLKALCSSVGELVVAPALDGPLGRIPACAGAAIAVAGVVILARRNRVTHYHAFALGFVPLLVAWHYPPIARFVLPLAPLLLAGVSVAALSAWRAVSERRPGAPGVLALLTLATLALMAPLAATGVYAGPLAGLYFRADRDREQRSGILPEYRWIQANTPPGVAFVAGDGALLYLYTGRRAMGPVMPSRLFYHSDVRGVEREYRGIGAFAARNHLDYLLRTPLDFNGDFAPALGRRLVDEALSDPRRFRLIHSSGQTTVYEVVTGAAGTDENAVPSAPSSESTH